ncbi:MAG TPA: helix-turn-helix transcriptional regulator [Verrucomicrobiae bacterium]|nr:helix-turn-helix transcriptional regulator [Verrucomicrobiae bacterium]
MIAHPIGSYQTPEKQLDAQRKFVANMVLSKSVKTMRDKKSSFGEFIRKMRQNRQEPLRVIAAAVGIDSTHLSKLEHGDRFPTDAQISRFARFFKVPEVELKGRVIADRVTSEYGNEDAALYAAHILKERATPYKTSPK